MDSRPAGPRQQVQPQTGDKRTAAYESIFGRPSASHHQLAPQPTGLSYSPSVYGSPHPQGNGQQYNYQPQPQQLYPQHLERRPSHTSFAPSQAAAYPAQQSTFRQSYVSTASQQPPPSQQQQYPIYQQSLYGGSPASLAAPSVHSRAKSLAGAPYVAGAIPPPADEPPDASLEALTRSGLTPAQAYQAQVYLNSPAGQQSGWNGQGAVPPAALRPMSLPTNGGQRQLMTQSAIDVPTLGLNLDADDGRLGIDFGSQSDRSNESSELPWARSVDHITRGFFLLLIYLTS